MSKLGQPKQHVPVFVGSTYEDLKEYRTAVRETLHQLETIVRGMEYFGSKPGSPKEECLKAVQSCKAYIGIFAMRYGSIDEETGKSMTHLEYEEASRLKLTILVYLIDEQNQPILPKHVETGDNAKLLVELKNELKKKYTVSFFTTPEDLSKRIAQDLPPILQYIGFAIEPEAKELITADAKEILERFKARPAKYSGREITVDCTISGDVKAVSNQGCEALGLPLGDAIKRRVDSEVLGKRQTIFATHQMADWLESTSKGAQVTVRLKLVSGNYIDVIYSEDGPINKKHLVQGYQVTEVLRDATSQEDAQHQDSADA
jgi:hypothetical protein